MTALGVPRSIRPRKRPGARAADPGAPARTGTGRSPRVVVLTARVGAGHDRPAYELAARLRARGAVAEVHDYLDALPRFGQVIIGDGYGVVVNRMPRFFDWLFHALEHRGLVRWIILTFLMLSERTVRRWTRDADVVVSTFPLSCQTLGRMRGAGHIDVPVVSYLTDPAPHRMWLHPGVDVHLSVTSACADAADEVYGVAVRPAGPLVDPRFSRAHTDADRAATRRELGLGDDETAVLISAGSLGLGDVPALVDAALTSPAAHVLVLCGRNADLREQLDARERVTALGWRDDVPALMAAADVLLHNAGGLSVTEALVANLPAVTYHPIPGHGRANATVLAEAGLAPWPETPAGLATVLDGIGSTSPLSPWPATPEGDVAAIVLELAAEERQAVPAA
ncbi:MGDG synthase family glycosyltransferase [Actinomycetospora sp. TBRC 11914]|uniref:MGDG synthase family glycosyltransferase n=1 Tax=Actinomycetospora sp. TBRC 11914 TaxID=2729387 RepID=UPI00145DA320|nr:glycosyltransferase [Actinomycetospora sp. TBRC 11914]NMO92130.1 glycosyltransferase [Actinomycetospora sp. TBRC 11914]